MCFKNNKKVFKKILLPLQHPEYFHDFVAQVVDDFDGDAAG